MKKRLLMIIGIILFLPVYTYMGIKWIFTGEFDIKIYPKIKPILIYLDKIFFK